MQIPWLPFGARVSFSTESLTTIRRFVWQSTSQPSQPSGFVWV